MLRKSRSNQMTIGDILMTFGGGGDVTVFRVVHGMSGLKHKEDSSQLFSF